MIDAKYEIERLLAFGEAHALIKKWDVIPVRNALLTLFDEKEPYAGEEGLDDVKTLSSPEPILERLLDVAAERGIIPEDTVTQRDLYNAKIMGLLMPRASEVAEAFWHTAEGNSIKEATDAFYALSQASNYIRTDRIAKNLYWTSDSPYGKLEVTINLSKPEKDPKAIAAARTQKQTNYPKCLLCVENVGYAGHLTHPARQNHRVIPLTLAGEQWYFQYSPYVYYNEHCIILNEQHVPMKIAEPTFVRLFDFVEQFPHYFIGSNADLPIVGGSILSHDHFQGGRHDFPMAVAPIATPFKQKEFPSVTGGIVRWPMSVIRLASASRDDLTRLIMHVLDAWREYTDERANVLAYTEEEGERVPHNTITPIVRKNAKDEFEIDLVLRNNLTSAEHPLGIYHPHEELHHIKKENIGLIEVMGLAILPGRLDGELRAFMPYLTGEKGYDPNTLSQDEALGKHVPWFNVLLSNHGTGHSEEKANEILRAEVGDVFCTVLEHAGVYTWDNDGKAAFARFMAHVGFTLLDD